uniref:Gustatory receptor n=1 Tax=Phlebotomus papatasi TaxID=29031 RepID=A0A240SYT5_PHLPP
MESESIIKFGIARNILAFYQLCGMLLITFPRKSQIEKFLKCLGIFHLLFLFVSLAISLYYFDYLFDARNPLGFARTRCLLQPSLDSLIIPIITNSTPHPMLTRMMNFRIYLTRNRRNFCSISMSCVLKIFSKFTYNCQIFLCNSREDIELYREFFEIIIEETNSAVSLSRDTQQKPVKQFILYRKCKCLKSSINTLWLIIKYINKSFGYSIFVNITMNFIILIVHYYWNFKALFLNTSSNPTASLLCSIPLVAVLLPFIQSCDASIRPFRQIKHLIGKIQLQSDNRQFNRFIKQLSLQMLQYSIHLDASGFFSINFELLQAVSVSYFKGKITQTVKSLPSLSISLYRNVFRD